MISCALTLAITWKPAAEREGESFQWIAGHISAHGVILTAVGFEPTRLRTGASSQRLRPLGQTVMFDRDEPAAEKEGESLQ